MCQQVLQFCTGSTKPLLFAGSFISILLAIAIGYTGCTTNALFNTIDPQIAQSMSLGYYLQLAASAYLILITMFSCYAAYYDQKHSIRALAFLTTLNFLLALAAISMMPQGQDLTKDFENSLKLAMPEYDYTKKDNLTDTQSSQSQPAQLSSMNSSRSPELTGSRSSRSTEIEGAPSGQVATPNWTKENATAVWDSLQSRGCCGLRNGTKDWANGLPKSCCSKNDWTNNDKRLTCKDVDKEHSLGCINLIESTSLNLLIVLALIALVNLYLASISGISAFRTLHYDEASQGGAYS